MTRLYNAITAGRQKKPYGMTLSLEIQDKIPQESKAVKCTDNLYLIRTEDGAKLYDTVTGKLSAPNDYPETDRADGFVTEISLAPGVILKAKFNPRQLVLEDEEIPASIRDAGRNVLMIETNEGDMIIMDVSRFLLYALISGQFICGYVEV